MSLTVGTITGTLAGASGLGPRRPVAAGPNTPEAPAGSVDQVELSDRARQIAGQVEIKDGFDQAKVDAVRAALRDGTYLNPDKFDAALDGLIDEALRG